MLTLLKAKKIYFITGLIILLFVGFIFLYYKRNTKKVKIFAQPLNPAIESYFKQQLKHEQGFFDSNSKQKTIDSTLSHGVNLSKLQSFVQLLKPEMERYLEQELKRRQVFFASTPKQDGKVFRLVVPSSLERETVFNVTLGYENNTAVLKGKVFTRQQKELIEKVAKKSFKNQVHSQLSSFPYDDIGADYGITIKPFSNLYVKPRQEVGDNLATQVHLGTPVKLLEYSPDKKFVRVRIEDDGYIAWIQRQDLIETDQATFKQWVNFPQALLAKTIKQPQNLYFGTRLRYVPNQQLEKVEALIPSNSRKVLKSGKASVTNAVLKPKLIQLKRQDILLNQAPADKFTLLKIAKQFLPEGKQGRVTYLWGGTVGNQLDCSGYVQTVFRAGNIYLPRDADQQELYTQRVAQTLQKIGELQPGDLVFFSKNRRAATHVGIYIGNYQFIHSSGGGVYSGVKISRLKDGDNYDKALQAIYFGGGRVPKRTN